MAVERNAPREWHRLFGLLLTDYFTDLPFTVEIERDLSEQQQFLDVVIVRRGRRRFHGRLPDGMDGLAAHNLITFKSHHESLSTWAMKELASHSVAYRKLVSRSPTDLLPEDQFRMYAVCARFPQTLSGKVPWRERQAGVYDCQWATDAVSVIVAGELPREEQNAPLHLFSASPELVRYAQGVYRQHSENTSGLLSQLFERFQLEDFAMAFTMEDFQRQYAFEHFPRLTPAERLAAIRLMPPEELLEVLKSLLPKERLADLSPEQIRQHLEQQTANRPTEGRKPRRKR
jgi:hypothetical protein